MPLPSKGVAWDQIASRLDLAKEKDISWRRGRMAVYFYYLDQALEEVQQKAYLAFWTENSLGKRAFPSLAALEGEIVETGLALMQAPHGATGTFTSGGSESIFLAMQTARDHARGERGITTPNIVLPRTAHPAFNRAGHALGLEVRRVPTTRADYKADIGTMQNRIDHNTIALGGSAPCYPFGVFDPIRDLAALAQSRGLWMHVDACVGGFLAPFWKKLGEAVPAWDFSVPGVTSISADLHKHGMAPKGASLLLLRSADVAQRHQTFSFDDWERGPYVSRTMQGTRPGGAVAGAWAVLQHLGEDGYLRCARLIRDAKRQLADGIGEIDGLAVLQPSELSILLYRSNDPAIDIAAVGEALERRGWLVGRITEPPAIHLHLNPIHNESVREYLRDVRDAVDEVRGKSPRSKVGVSTY